MHSDVEHTDVRTEAVSRGGSRGGAGGAQGPPTAGNSMEPP
jgi:hypothetical protein